MNFPRGWMLAATATLGCRQPPPDATCEGAVRQWLEKMELANTDARALKDALGLLGPKARANLEERAQRASQSLGRQVEPAEILAPGRFGTNFRPKKMVPIEQRGSVTVLVTGDDPADRAVVVCTEEHGVYRVEPGLPEPAPIVRSRDAGR